MVKIRLRRTGAKKNPHYRVVAADSRAPRDGRFIEILGHYNPRTDPVTFKVDKERVTYWLSVGAQPTDPVKRLLNNLGTLDSSVKPENSAEPAQPLADATGETSDAIVEPGVPEQTEAPEAA
jgi:small subunit ribosomal protein S16